MSDELLRAILAHNQNLCFGGRELDQAELDLIKECRGEGAPVITRGPNPKDWPEDFPHENGNYTCICYKCQSHFTGNKRRRTCKECYREFPDVKVEPQRLGQEGANELKPKRPRK